MKRQVESGCDAVASASLRLVSDERTRPSLEQRIDQLFDELHRPVCRYLLWLGVSRAEAEELTQETFLRLFEHLRDGGDDRHLRGWVYRVAHNLSINAVKRQRFIDALDSSQWSDVMTQQFDPAVGPEDALLRRERLQRVKAAIATLPAHQRECLFLRAEGFRYREIADILNVSVPNVGESLRRAVEKLAKKAHD
jgi:RNA polymerase sigma-70 factor, ECF subfamily